MLSVRESAPFVFYYILYNFCFEDFQFIRICNCINQATAFLWHTRQQACFIFYFIVDFVSMNFHML